VPRSRPFSTRNAALSWNVRTARRSGSAEVLSPGLGGQSPPFATPTLVAVGGIIASGKSTVAQWVASEMGAPVVDADRTRKHMLGVELRSM